MDDLQSFLSSLKGKKILIWGLGANEGAVGVAKFFASHGASIRATDMKKREALEESIKALSEFPDIEYILGEHREEDFLWADIIMRNPAIPPSAPLLKFALNNGKQVEMELSLFMKYCKAHIVGITGTRGKTTTTALITKILEDAGLKVTTGGNNRTPLLLQLETLTSDTYIVIEMSSFQLSNCTTSPEVIVVTNIYPDHLNWHPDMVDYIKSKANIVRFQKNSDIAVLN
jgi:UDP-N-acetylmuramoylalanine--D-glutamate ligase